MSSLGEALELVVLLRDGGVYDGRTWRTYKSVDAFKLATQGEQVEMFPGHTTPLVSAWLEHPDRLDEGGPCGLVLRGGLVQ